MSMPAVKETASLLADGAEFFLLFDLSSSSSPDTQLSRQDVEQSKERETDRKIERQRKRIVVFLSPSLSLFSCMGRTDAKG